MPKARKPRSELFLAMGQAGLPSQVEVAGALYVLRDTLKHDSWAATGLYEGPTGRIICKFNRVRPVFGVPLGWLGRMLGRREVHMLHRLEGVPNVARGMGEVRVDGHVMLHAVARQFVEGRPLRPRQYVADDFFPRLRAALDEIHRRGAAYVDLHKRDNIIVGVDGQPYLIDFQVSWGASRTPGVWSRLWLSGALLRMLQRSDDYHLLKHMIRHRADLVPPGQRNIDRLRPWPNRVARWLGDPIRFLRRRLLVLLSMRAGKGYARSEMHLEDADRKPPGPGA
jgi:hypothetical protein